jgi:HEPN domain-containing protein
MLKPGKTFNLSKQTKRFMATIVKAEDRHAYKNAMIQAQLASEIVIKSAPRDKNAPRGNANYQTNDTGTASTQV